MEWDEWLELLKAALDDRVADSEGTGSSEGFTLMTVLLEDVAIAVEVTEGGSSLADVMLLWIGQTT